MGRVIGEPTIRAVREKLEAIQKGSAFDNAEAGSENTWRHT
jgi:hypothetical protein